MYILWISCSHSGDNAPQQVPRAGELAGVLSGALPPECKQAYPQGYTQGSKTAAFTLTHRDDDDYGHVPLVVPFRQSIGIDWFGKDTTRITEKHARSGRRATRAAVFEKVIPGRRLTRELTVVNVRNKETPTIHTGQTKFTFCRHRWGIFQNISRRVF